MTSFGVILLLLIFLASSSNDISYLILFISINKLITELAVTLSRVQEKISRINILYLSNSIPLLLMFTTRQMLSMQEYFLIWCYSSLFSAVIGMLFILQYICSRKIKFDLKELLEGKKFRNIFKSGIFLAIVGFSTPLLASFDKLILTAISYDTQSLGLMQLADNISMIISLSIATVLFVITPKMIKNLDQGLISNHKFLRKGYTIFLIIAAIIFGLILLFYPAFLYFFPSYELLYPLLLQTATRLTILSLFMINILVMVHSFELIQIVEIVKTCFIFLILLFLSTLYFDEKNYFYVLPLCGFVSSIVLHINIFRNKNMREVIK